jgi:ketosteroid isomerase-like protein
MKYWSDDVATYEAMPGEMAETKGKEAAVAKAQWWYDNHDVHSFQSEGPYVHGDTFLIGMDIDVTPKGGERMQMKEMVAYKVADGRVVEERYYY